MLSTLSTLDFFHQFMGKIKQTPNWASMVNTVEDSPWHREANVAVHTEMCIDQYLKRFADIRTHRQQLLTLMALCFHDFGKPEAEETLEKKEEPGVFYRRYAGHEPISGNEFMSFMCDNHELRQFFFDQGFGWKDVRTIKVMIEHHLPYGLKNVQKRENLKQMLEFTLGDDECCFYDMLRCDGAGRISDNHEEKLKNVETWIDEFQQVVPKIRIIKDGSPKLILVVGVSGAGKSTFINALNVDKRFKVFSEDVLRVQYAHETMPYEDWALLEVMTEADRYQAAWNFCHLNKESKFDQYSKQHYASLLATGEDIIVDRMNHGRKARATYIQPAKDKGYRVETYELFVSESVAKARQKTRGDKSLPDYRVHQVYMQLETPWYGPEVDKFTIVPPGVK